MGRHRFIFTLGQLAIAIALLFTGCASEQTVFIQGDTQRGLASWYGSEEQGGPTADGERFDRWQLTAAHRHIPFGSIVRVTDTRNGNAVDVRINDRGPWAGDERIIDVSEAAADVLQMKRDGIVPVEIEIIRLGPGRRPSTVE